MTNPAGGSGRDILLVGSVPLGSASEVFATCARALGDHVKRLPDGETGERTNWIRWQRAVLAATPGLEPVPATPGAPQPGYVPLPPFRVVPNAGTKLAFGRLGFAAAAAASWTEFQRLRDAGTIAGGQRFQVSLPTPLAVIAQYFEAASQAAAEAPYEAALVAELHDILKLIPHTELALQWDVAIEFAILEGLYPAYFAPAFDGIIERLLRLAALVPEPAELGIHLCYGDSGHKHFKEPEDTALMVRVANALADGITRRLHWLHMPVPRGRGDAGYFAPLRGLHLPPGCRLFLGLVHDTDGLAGTRARLRTAEAFAPAEFGIATECGFGRRDPASVPRLLQLHVNAATA